MKRLFKMILLLSFALLLVACNKGGVEYSKDATPENPMILSLAHNMAENHTVHIALEEFAQEPRPHYQADRLDIS